MTRLTGEPDRQQWAEQLLSDEKLGTFLQVVIHLSHYKYALECLIQVSVPGAIDNAATSFYMDVLYKYLADWLAVSGEAGEDVLRQALTKVNLADALKPIEALLDSKADNTTFRRLVKDYRNYQGVHRPFEGGIQVILARKHRIDVNAFQEVLIDFFDKMYVHMVKLQCCVESAFERAYPDVYRLFRTGGWFHSAR